MPAVEARPILEGAAGTRVLLRGLRRRGCCKNRAGTGDWPYGLDHVTACMPPGEMACHTLVTLHAGHNHNWRTTIAAEKSQFFAIASGAVSAFASLEGTGDAVTFRSGQFRKARVLSHSLSHPLRFQTTLPYLTFATSGTSSLRCCPAPCSPQLVIMTQNAGA